MRRLLHTLAIAILVISVVGCIITAYVGIWSINVEREDPAIFAKWFLTWIVTFLGGTLLSLVTIDKRR